MNERCINLPTTWSPLYLPLGMLSCQCPRSQSRDSKSLFLTLFSVQHLQDQSERLTAMVLTTQNRSGLSWKCYTEKGGEGLQIPIPLKGKYSGGPGGGEGVAFTLMAQSLCLWYMESEEETFIDLQQSWEWWLSSQVLIPKKKFTHTLRYL